MASRDGSPSSRVRAAASDWQSPRELRALGLRVLLNAPSSERLGQICAELGAEPLVADITDPLVPGRLLTEARGRFGRCDLVINNAGATEVGPIGSIDIDRVCAMVRVNVEAAYRVAYTFIRHFVAQGSGHPRYCSRDRFQHEINMNRIVGEDHPPLGRLADDARLQ
ncbi:MAG: SDR family NAD(P)-dependent oxidoreductase [Steroidobacteraceae bacterium]